jgi:uncharacterized protein (TIGR02466 family)
MDRILWSLFSKPLYKGDIDVGNIDYSKVEWMPNNSNWVSKDLRVLEDEQFKRIAAQATIIMHEFFHGVMSVKPGTELYFTESWLNKTEKGQSHHRHWHPNSVLSGIVYLSTSGDSGKTRFVSSDYSTFEFEANEANIYNSKTWTITPEVGKILIFPSSLEHMVDPYEGDEPRITLAFNTFVKGPISSNPLTNLSI